MRRKSTDHSASRRALEKRVIFSSSVDVTKHYRGPLILGEEFSRSCSVTFIAPIGSHERTQQIAESVKVVDMKAGRFAQSRFTRRAIAVLKVTQLTWRSDIAVCVEPGFALCMVPIKLIRGSRVTFVLSCGEDYDTLEDLSAIELLAYRMAIKHADAVIDVTDSRLSDRRKKTGYSGPGFVMPNTLRRSQVAAPATSHRDVPVVTYAGNTLSSNVGFERLLQALSLTRHPIRFLLFPYGTQAEVDRIRNRAIACLGSDRVDVRNPVMVDELHRILALEADIGLIHYPVDLNNGLTTFAPGKVFDYLRSGLQFVSTPNADLGQIAERCDSTISDGDQPEDFAAAIDRTIENWNYKVTTPRDRQRLFDETWSGDSIAQGIVTALKALARN
jgi:hypothetical protein